MRWLTFLASLLSFPAWAQQAVVGGSLTKPGDYFGQIFFSLILVLVLIFVVAWLLRRFNKFSAVANGNLQVHGVLQVGQRERIVLLEVGEKQLLIGVTPNRISTLHELETPIDFATDKQATQLSGKFYQRLQEALGQRNSE